MTDQPKICPTCGKPLAASQTSAGTRAGDQGTARGTHAENRAETLAREIVTHVETITQKDKVIQELNGQIASLQSEIRETRQQLSTARIESNSARPGARRPGSQVSTTKGLAYRDPTRLLLKHIVLYLGVAAVCIAGTAILVNVLSPNDNKTAGTNAPYASAYKSAMARDIIQANLGIPFVIDDVEVTLTNPRIGPILQVTILGKEAPSEESYLKIDVTLSNRNPHAEIIVHQPWQSAQISDEQNRKYRPVNERAFDLIQEIKGHITSTSIKPGETASDIMLFPWRESDATSFTLIADPDFRRLSDDERMVQISLSSFRASFDRTSITGP